MGKDRFTINPFPALQLSDEDKLQLLNLARTLIQANFERDEDFYTTKQRKVDLSRWKPTKERENMHVYTERASYQAAHSKVDANGNAKLPEILSVGTVEGRLDDMMFGVVNPTIEETRIKASYVHDLSGACLLSTIVKPTIEEPFTSVVVKWMELDIPLHKTNILQNRDYVYLEATGFVTKPNGERAGYHFLHSIDFPQIHKLPNRVRGDLSICGFFRQAAPNVIHVCKTGLLDPAGDMIRMLAVPVMAAAFLSPLRYVYCGHMRKLTWRMEKRHAEARQHGIPDPGPYCVSCAKPASSVFSFGSSNSKGSNTCRSCFHSVCSACKIKRKISIVTADMELVQRKVSFCSACIADVTRSSAVEIAGAMIEEQANTKASFLIPNSARRTHASSIGSYSTSSSGGSTDF